MFENASKDPMELSRCGAKARSNGGEPCRQPALANGRCRFHGGLSTGPKTEAGKERCIAAVTKHGRRSCRVIAQNRILMKKLKEAKAFLKSLY